MKVAISQPRYLPALNYLQRILISDVFVILDNVQHQRRAYEQRNKIKSTNSKGVWCSIPLDKDSSRPKIFSLKIAGSTWIEEHKTLIKAYYRHAEFFDEDLLNYLYKDLEGSNFIKNIMTMTINICELLNINYNFIYASELELDSSNDQLLYDITKKVGGNEYISGPNGRDYIVKEKFHNIKLTYHEFHFPEYEQVNGGFIPWMSIVDQLFNIGLEQTKEYIFNKPILKDK